MLDYLDLVDPIEISDEEIRAEILDCPCALCKIEACLAIGDSETAMALARRIFGKIASA